MNSFIGDAEPDCALVFSGGGARGAYQVGAWEAFHQSGFDQRVVSVYGTSVGAINGAAFAQGNLELAREIWKMISYDRVFKNVLPPRKLKNSRDYLQWLRLAIREKGINVEPLKKLLFDTLDETVIRNSEIDFGLVTYDLTHRKALYLRKRDIPEGKLVDYVIASSTFPVFKVHAIEDKKYTDGGLYDNRPVRFVDSDEKAQCLICVDVTIARHFWKNKRTRKKMEIDYLRPSRLLGSPLAFDNGRILRNMKLGYEDTLKWIESKK